MNKSRILIRLSSSRDELKFKASIASFLLKLLLVLVPSNFFQKKKFIKLYLKHMLLFVKQLYLNEA